MAKNYKYIFEQQYRPAGDRRAPHVLEAIVVLMDELGWGAMRDIAGNSVELTREAISETIDARARDLRIDCGPIPVQLMVESRKSEIVCGVMLDVGAPPGGAFIDAFQYWFPEDRPAPSPRMLVRLLQVGEPFEAFLGEISNESFFYERSRRCANSGFRRPAFIRGFHFLGSELVGQLGGIEKCLGMPAHDVKAFRDGVLIRLTDGPFDPEIPAHLDIQDRAMVYLGL